MTASIEFVQFRKTSGMASGVTDVVMNKDVGGAIGWGFFGKPHLSGYQSPPLLGAAIQYPVKAGSTSWQVWTAVRVVGYTFSVVNEVRIFLNQYIPAGLGTIATQGGVSARIPQGSPPAASGLFVRSLPGNIEMGIPPTPIETIIPSSAPSYGLPLPVDAGWLMLQEYNALDDYIDIEEASTAVPANSADLTPFREQVDELTVKAIYSSDPEPRYSNFAIMNLVVSSDATAGVVYPVEVGVTWNES